MKKILIAATALGILAATAPAADAQVHHRHHRHMYYGHYHHRWFPNYWSGNSCDPYYGCDYGYSPYYYQPYYEPMPFFGFGFGFGGGGHWHRASYSPERDR